MRIRITVERDVPAAPGESGPFFALLPRRSAPALGTWLPSLCLHAALLGTMLLNAAPVLRHGDLRGHGDPLIIRLNGRKYHVSRLSPGQVLTFGAASGKRNQQSSAARGAEEFADQSRELVVAGGMRKPS